MWRTTKKKNTNVDVGGGFDQRKRRKSIKTSGLTEEFTGKKRGKIGEKLPTGGRPCKMGESIGER